MVTTTSPSTVSTAMTMMLNRTHMLAYFTDSGLVTALARNGRGMIQATAFAFVPDKMRQNMEHMVWLALSGNWELGTGPVVCVYLLGVHRRGMRGNRGLALDEALGSVIGSLFLDNPHTLVLVLSNTGM